jgi:hypothetical protein
MGLFSRAQRLTETTADPPVTGPGLVLTSALDLDGCLQALGRTLLGLRVPEYTHLPPFTEASWAWNGERGDAPETVVICTDRAGDHVLVAFWPESGGCRIGVVPLSGDQQPGGDQPGDRQPGGWQPGEPECPMVAAWRQRDVSLSRPAGVLAAGMIRLVPPVLPPGWVAEIVAAAGYRPTRRNIQIASRAAGSLFLGRAELFIGHREPRAARRFVRRHSRRQPMNEKALQEIIDDLARTDPGVLPYLQWLPVRARAMMLEHVRDPGTFWGGLDR